MFLVLYSTPLISLCKQIWVWLLTMNFTIFLITDTLPLSFEEQELRKHLRVDRNDSY